MSFLQPSFDKLFITSNTNFNFELGESNVYTLGNIGSHRVVSTKLPSVGHTREAMIAAGNTTTRLLGMILLINSSSSSSEQSSAKSKEIICVFITFIGTFQKADFVFLIGVGGGVPHFTDYNKHVRLGDLVVSAPTEHQKYEQIMVEYAFVMFSLFKRFFFMQECLHVL